MAYWKYTNNKLQIIQDEVYRQFVKLRKLIKDQIFQPRSNYVIAPDFQSIQEAY